MGFAASESNPAPFLPDLLVALHWQSLCATARSFRFDRRLVQNAIKRVSPSLIRLALVSKDDAYRVALLDRVRPLIEEQLGAGLCDTLGVILLTYDDVLDRLDPRFDTSATRRLRERDKDFELTEGSYVAITTPHTVGSFIEITSGIRKGRITYSVDKTAPPALVRPAPFHDVFLHVELGAAEDADP